MTRMICHPKSLCDYPCDPRQGPQISGESCCQWTCQQHLLQLLFLLWSEPRPSPWMGLRFQCFQTTLFQSLLPPTNRRRRSFHQTRYFTDTFTFQKQLSSDHTPHLQFFGTTFWSHTGNLNTDIPFNQRRSILPLFPQGAAGPELAQPRREAGDVGCRAFLAGLRRGRLSARRHQHDL